MRKIVSTVVFMVAAAIRAAMPTVDGVTVTDVDGMLTVNYTLYAASAVITFDATTNGVPVDAAHFKSATGDIWKLMPAGSGTFTWRPANDIPLFNLADANLQVRVKAWPTDAPPDYMVVSLATNATTRVTVAYYECAEQLPGKVTDPVYKTSKLVMRKIPAAGVTWRMGSPSTELGRQLYTGASETLHYVTLTEDYYLGVYPVTGAQWDYVRGSSGKSRLAVKANNMRALRGNQSGNGDAMWPGDGHLITKTDSILYIIRQYTGIDFDIPTEAQWEFACRAGEKAALYTGNEISDTATCAEVDEVAWYKGNYPHTLTTWPTFMEVGLKKPNAYGLYDMLGNIWEYCLDRYQSNLGSGAVTDPKGGTSGTQYVKRGGAICSPASLCRAAARSRDGGEGNWADPFDTSLQHCDTGFRLWAAARAVK